MKRISEAGAVLICLAIVLLGMAGWLLPVDSWLRDHRFGLATRGASGDTIFVEIDSTSLRSVGVWPWPRHVYAEILDRLMDAGSGSVIFDIDFSAPSLDMEDATFERALRDAGGFAYLAAFRQQSDASGHIDFNVPLPRFARNADSVAVNVRLDSSGIVRTYPLAMPIEGMTLSSAAAHLAGFAGAASGEISIDFTINPQSIPRISVSDILAGRIDASRLVGKQVVVGASAVELRDFFIVPRYGIIPGALLQILAAETLRQGRNISSLGPWPGIAILLVIILGLAAFRHRMSVRTVLASALACMIAVEISAAILQVWGSIFFDTAALNMCLLAIGAAAVLEEMHRRGVEKRRAESRLRYLATHDELTGLVSRSSFIQLIDQAARQDSEFAVLVLELRRFRAINYTLGRERGDILLKQVAARLIEIAPGPAARLGGDSFALLVETASRGEVVGIGQNIIDVLGSPYEVDLHKVMIAANCGVAHSANATSNANAILANADIALAASRHRRGSGLAVFDPEMASLLAERQQLDACLRRAVFGGEIALVYQPQVDIATGRTIGVEALSRWTHTELGPVSPQRFIAAAEETGLIVEIGRLALDMACMQAMEWPEDIRVAVNVSPVQFELSDLPSDIAAALARSGLPPSRLEIELTEGVFVKDAATVIDQLHAISEMGVSIALDDFGTGYSSLAYLAKLPIDRIKIDQGFVKRLPSDQESQLIVTTVINLAHALGKEVVAEGIETLEQATFLRMLGCTVGQGYYFARPTAPLDLRFGDEDLRGTAGANPRKAAMA